MKNKMMRLASLLMVAVLLTTSVVSGTYAKYVTSDEAGDKARVAKWGVTVTAEGKDSTFVKTYETSHETVVSSDTEDVVAPGTKNTSGLTFTVDGKPEVDVKLTIAMTVDEDVFLKAGTYLDTTTGVADDDFTFTGENYFPVVFTLTKDGSQVAKGNLGAIAAYLNADAQQETFEANDPATIKTVYNLTWAWDYGTFADVSENDKKDTLLGNLAANPDDYTYKAGMDKDYSTRIKFNIKVTATQID